MTEAPSPWGGRGERLLTYNLSPITHKQTIINKQRSSTCRSFVYIYDDNKSLHHLSHLHGAIAHQVLDDGDALLQASYTHAIYGIVGT